jgi:hypothetical protein
MTDPKAASLHEINWSIYTKYSTDIQAEAQSRSIKTDGAFWQAVSTKKLAFSLEAHSLAKNAFDASDAWKIEQTGIESTVGSARMTKAAITSLLNRSDEIVVHGEMVICIIRGSTKSYAKEIKDYAALLHECDSIGQIRFTDLPYEIYLEWAEKKQK